VRNRVSSVVARLTKFLESKNVAAGPWGEAMVIQRKTISSLSHQRDSTDFPRPTAGNISTLLHSSRDTACAYRRALRGSRQLPVATSPISSSPPQSGHCSNPCLVQFWRHVLDIG